MHNPRINKRTSCTGQVRTGTLRRRGGQAASRRLRAKASGPRRRDPRNRRVERGARGGGAGLSANACVNDHRRALVGRLSRRRGRRGPPGRGRGGPWAGAPAGPGVPPPRGRGRGGEYERGREGGREPLRGPRTLGGWLSLGCACFRRCARRARWSRAARSGRSCRAS